MTFSHRKEATSSTCLNDAFSWADSTCGLLYIYLQNDWGWNRFWGEGRGCHAICPIEIAELCPEGLNPQIVSIPQICRRALLQTGTHLEFGPFRVMPRFKKADCFKWGGDCPILEPDLILIWRFKRKNLKRIYCATIHSSWGIDSGSSIWF